MWKVTTHGSWFHEVKTEYGRYSYSTIPFKDISINKVRFYPSMDGESIIDIDIEVIYKKGAPYVAKNAHMRAIKQHHNMMLRLAH